jgi:putative acetyltransferase
MEYKLRPATNQDCAAVRELIFGVLGEYGLQPDPGGTDSDLEDIELSYHQSGGSFTVMEDESGRIVGTVGFVPNGPGSCELRKMYLAKSSRGRGWGKVLLDHALAEAKTRGCTEATLETASVLGEAIALYERYGFRRYAAPHLARRCDTAYRLELRD